MPFNGELFEELRATIHKNLSSGWITPTTQTKLLEEIMSITNKYVDIAYDMGYKNSTKTD
jgi:septum formation topological specificity factor MinE